MENLFYAHSDPQQAMEKWQSLQEHLQNTANLVKQFSSSFCEEGFAENLGLLHDLGKYQPTFQKRIRGSDVRIEHATAGAIEIKAPLGQYCIVGHHSGLPDFGSTMDGDDMSTLQARLHRPTEDYSYFKHEITPRPAMGNPTKNAVNLQNPDKVSIDKEFAFWTRMMFSCLTDGDFLDTEQFYQSDPSRGLKVNFSCCLKQLQDKVHGFSAITSVNQARCRIRKQVMARADQGAEIYFLNMPTGSGKTLTSMEFALCRAIAQRKKHIIYIIPYTSIIEQTAKVFKDLFGENSVLEHHCNFDWNKIADDTAREKLQKSCENWDCSITVTTNVQFFQSIYGNKSSHLRKLHNIADSILIFDEVHMLPMKFFQPCLEAIQILTQRYDCEALFLSATMPDFDVWLDKFQCKQVKTLDLTPDKQDFSHFGQYTIENLGVISTEALVEKVQQGQQALVVVNQKKTAKALYQALTCKKYHLSTYMNHQDRGATIELVRQSLKSQEPFCLVSTSLIEAGVDLDFQVVFRELMGLDNLLQTAGRCNREGKRTDSIIYSFELDTPTKSDDVKVRQSFTREIFETFSDVTSTGAIQQYFHRLYQYSLQDMTQMDFKKYIKGPFRYNFRECAEEFQIIQEHTRDVVIVADEAVEKMLQQLERSPKSTKRTLQKYVISLREYEYQELLDQGVIGTINGVDFLSNPQYYTAETGILFEDNHDYIY